MKKILLPILLLITFFSCSKNEGGNNTDYNVEEIATAKGGQSPQVSTSGGIYKAYLTQIGASDPMITIFENTIGNLVWTRFSIGNYQGVLSGAFPVNKTFIPVFGSMGGSTQIPIAYSLPNQYFYSVIPGSDGNSILLQIYDANYNNVDLSTISAEGQALPIWVEVYP